MSITPPPPGCRLCGTPMTRMLDGQTSACPRCDSVPPQTVLDERAHRRATRPEGSPE